MSPENTSTALLHHLIQRDPLYHAAYPLATLAHFDEIVAPEFWEIGASGRSYDRAFAREVLRKRSQTPAASDWQTEEAQLSTLTNDIVLLSYVLHQPNRATRRITLWRLENAVWKAVYHQGTVISASI